MIAAILFISFFVMLIIGLPIAICLGMSSAITVFVASSTDPKFSMLDLSIIATNTYTGIARFMLLAIPLPGREKRQMSRHMPGEMKPGLTAWMQHLSQYRLPAIYGSL